MRGFAAICAGALALLVGCGSGQPEGSSKVLSGTLRGLIANRDAPPPPKITATRAQLAAAGLAAQPLLIVRMPTIESESGFFLLNTVDGTQVWQSGDNKATLQIRTSGVVVSSTGLGFDLYGADTAPLEAAFQSGEGGSYGRRYRHLARDLTSLHRRLVYCTLEPQGRETVVVFERSHVTEAYVERCAADEPHPDGTPFAFENRYWVGVADSIPWVSEQWMSQDLGVIRTERVFK